MPNTKAATKKTSTARKKANVWTDEEKAAMQERARELKAQARADKDKAAGEKDVLAKIAEMPKADRDIAERIHAIVAEVAPSLSPKTWYGMPGYANEDGKIVCYYTAAAKFKERYATFGFNADAKLDDGSMWPTSWALTKLTAADEKKLAALITKAVG